MSGQDENRALYLAWVRTHYPELYVEAVRQFRDTQYTAGMGDLIDDLMNQPAPGPDMTTPVIDVAGDSSTSGFFDSLVNGITNLASTYVTTQAQLDLVKMNSDRAARGQVPLTYVNGQMVPANSAQYPTTSFEQSLGKVSMSMWLLLGAVAIGGLLLSLLRPRH